MTPTTAVTDASGVATFTVSSIVTGVTTLTAADTTDSLPITPSSATVTFTPMPASAFTLSAIASPLVAGTTFTLQVTAVDAHGNTVTNYTGTVSLTSTDTAASLPVAHAFVGGDAGVFTFTALRLKTAGIRTVTASDGSISQASNDVTVVPAAVNAATSTIIASSSSVVADASATSTITVTLRDAYGNAVSGKTVGVSSSRGVNDTVSVVSAVTDANGGATFSVSSGSIGSSHMTAVDSTDSLSITPAYAVVSFTHQGVTGFDRESFRANYSTNVNTTNFTLADVNADGLVDIVAGDFSNSKLVVLLGIAGGRFADPVTRTAPCSLATDFVVARIDADAIVDIVVNCAGSASVVFFKGNGDGTFGAGTSIITPAVTPLGLASGDFNGDGKLDLLVGRGGGNNIARLYTGNGTGVFTGGATLDATNINLQTAAGDIDGDGKLDALILGSSNSLSLFKGNGDGTFAARVNKATSAGSKRMALGDLNGDGRLDVVEVNSTAPANINVFLNNGAGGLNNAVSYLTAASAPSYVSLADLNGDGFLDVITNYNAAAIDRGISFWLGTGTGTFGTAKKSTVSIGILSGQVQPYQRNADGKTDLITSDVNGMFVSIDGATLTGTQPAPVVSPGLSNQPRPVFADFNSDGKVDVAAADGTTFSIRTGAGGSYFAPATAPTLTGCTNPSGVVTNDFNNDGKPDLAVRCDANFFVLLGDGAGAFAVGTPVALTGTPSVYTMTRMVVDDFNGDGRMDLAITGSSADRMEVFLGDGIGGMTSSAVVNFTAASAPGTMVVVDWDLDGKLDIVVGVAGNFAYVKGDGTGGFAAPTYTVGPAAIWDLDSGDLDGDGFPDIIGVSNSGNQFYVIWGNGGSSLPAATSVTPAITVSGYVTIRLYDTDLDGKPEVFLVPNGGNGPQMFKLTGRAFGTPRVFMGGATLALDFVDIDGDHKPDLLQFVYDTTPFFQWNRGF